MRWMIVGNADGGEGSVRRYNERIEERTEVDDWLVLSIGTMSWNAKVFGDRRQ
jgi:hypothetical protein